MNKRGKFIMVDGIDGSGKGTIVEELCRLARKDGLQVFDLVAYEKRYHTLPQPEEVRGYDVIRSSEPTHSLVGLAIRNEIVRDNGRDYAGSAVTQAYALDRFLLYKRVIIPALRRGTWVIQERGVTTSLCYQPIQQEPVQLRKILSLEGNRLALRWRPDVVLLTTVDPQEAIRRLRSRSGKQDRAIFERFTFLRKAQRRFISRWFRLLFARRGSIVEHISTDGSLTATKAKAQQLWSTYSRKS